MNDVTVSYKLQSFQYKLLHQSHTTNKFAFMIGVWPTDKCTFCQQSPDSLVHMFCDCSGSQLFWYRVKQWLQNNVGMDITLDRVTIFFCCFNYFTFLQRMCKSVDQALGGGRVGMNVLSNKISIKYFRPVHGIQSLCFVDTS